MKKISFLKAFSICFCFILTSCADLSSTSTSITTKLMVPNSSTAVDIALKDCGIDKTDLIYSSCEEMGTNVCLVSLITEENECFYNVDMSTKTIEKININRDYNIKKNEFAKNDAYQAALAKSQLEEKEILYVDISTESSNNATSIEVILYTANVKYLYSFDLSTGKLLENHITQIEYNTTQSVCLSSEVALAIVTNYLNNTSISVDSLMKRRLRGNKVYDFQLSDENYVYNITINALFGDIIKDERRLKSKEKIFSQSGIVSDRGLIDFITEDINKKNLKNDYCYQSLNRTNYVWKAKFEDDKYYYVYEVDAYNVEVISFRKYVKNYYKFTTWAYSNYDSIGFSEKALEFGSNNGFDYSIKNIMSLSDITNKVNDIVDSIYITVKLKSDSNGLYYLAYGNNNDNFFIMSLDAVTGAVKEEKYQSIKSIITLSKRTIGFRTQDNFTYEIDAVYENDQLSYYVYGLCQYYTFVTKIDDKVEECDIIEKKCEEDKSKSYISKEMALTKALNGSLLIEEDVNSIEIRLNNYIVHNAYVVTFNRLDVQYRIEINCYTGLILSYSMNYSD